MNTLRLKYISVVDSEKNSLYRGTLKVKSDYETKSFQVEWNKYINGFIQFNNINSIQYIFRTNYGFELSIPFTEYVYNKLNDNTFEITYHAFRLDVTEDELKRPFSIDVDVDLKSIEETSEHSIADTPKSTASENDLKYMEKEVAEQTIRMSTDTPSHNVKCLENYPKNHPTRTTTILQYEKVHYSLPTSDNSKTTRSRIAARRINPGCMPRWWRKKNQFIK